MFSMGALNVETQRRGKKSTKQSETERIKSKANAHTHSHMHWISHHRRSLNRWPTTIARKPRSSSASLFVSPPPLDLVDVIVSLIVQCEIK